MLIAGLRPDIRLLLNEYDECAFNFLEQLSRDIHRRTSLTLQMMCYPGCKWILRRLKGYAW